MYVTIEILPHRKYGDFLFIIPLYSIGILAPKIAINSFTSFKKKDQIALKTGGIHMKRQYILAAMSEYNLRA